MLLEIKVLISIKEKNYNSLSFTDYPPTVLLDSHIYKDSIKKAVIPI